MFFQPESEIAAAGHVPSIDLALFIDIEYEVAPIISGHHVALAYDLYTEADDCGLPPVKD